jgi:hypothetical protein
MVSFIFEEMVYKTEGQKSVEFLYQFMNAAAAYIWIKSYWSEQGCVLQTVADVLNS